MFIANNHAAYISWEQHQSNLKRLQQHPMRGPRPGPARTTTAILAGCVVCGHCGCRMQTRYTPNLRYDCQRRALDYGAPTCQSFAGVSLEKLVSAQILEVVTPAGLELSRRAAEQTERERGALDRQWQLRLERAGQNTNRAYRQYNAVEPENRLVARTLERQWEQALIAQRSLQEEYTRFQQTQPTQLSAAERTHIEALAHDLPTIWHCAADSHCGQEAGNAFAVATSGRLGVESDGRTEGPVALDRRHDDGAPSVAAGEFLESVAGIA